ncbi:MAG: hypothetical protein COA62_15595 [Rhodobiaceae bacterium]|nr:MAG: hypothetical protein COA62_15595 [Rhodobiaceae bacterium]
MHYIDHSTADTDGANSQFTEGDVNTQIAATIATGPWLNDVQNNIMKVCEAGGLGTTKGESSDLLNAITQIATNQIGAQGNRVDNVNSPLTGNGSGGDALDIDFNTMDGTDVISIIGKLSLNSPGMVTLTAALKQATTELNGTVELATNAEAVLGTDTERAVTPSGVLAAILANFDLSVPYSTDELRGVVELATVDEVLNGTDTERAVTPEGVKAAIDAVPLPENSTFILSGLVELATNDEAVLGTDTERAVTPSGTKAAIDSQPSSTTGGRGLVELATNSEAAAGTDTSRALTPAGFIYALSQVFGTQFKNAQTWSGGAHGYLALPGPGNLVFQWGRSNGISNNGTATINFPISFPSACFGVQLARITEGNNSGNVRNLSRSNFGLRNRPHYSDSNSTANDYFWFAIGV